MNKPLDPNDWDDQINALLDGELDDNQAGQLKQAAGDNQVLAEAIVEAYQLQQALASMAVEPAPERLRRKLKAIPREHASHRQTRWFEPRWAMALAALPLVVLVAVTQMGPQQPSTAEIERASEEFALVMAYLGKASRATERHIDHALAEGISEPINKNTVQILTDQFDLDKEQET